MTHAARAELFIRDKERAHWHDQAIWVARSHRDKAVRGVPEWEQLRTLASQIKAHMLSKIDTYLEQFEANATANGIHVHWACTPQDHNRIVHDILKRHGVQRIVKSKSMLTEECGLNLYLEQQGLTVVDTDLGEFICQLRKEPPSHIVGPAIHVKLAEVGELFHEKLGTKAGADDPTYLTQQARAHLRQIFLAADAGITGVNFAIAETGGIVVCTNEGNADLGVQLPPLHIACMGIEKLLPRLDDLGVFIRILARSATGQPITVYTSHFHGPRPGGEMHVVIVDNGRTDILGRPEFRKSLACIRCGACLNTCPVYRRSGGHSYGAVIPGPIGSILEPANDRRRYADLPFASSLCGSCTDVCPVKIDLHHQLLAWRKELVGSGHVPKRKTLAMTLLGAVLARPWLYRLAGSMLRLSRYLPRFILYNKANKWGRQRELPVPARRSFRQMYRERQGGRP